MTQSCKYAMTITFHPRVRKYGTEEQYERYAHATIKYLQEMFPGCAMSVVCELTKSYDIHLHGVIRFNLLVMRKKCRIDRMFRDAFRVHPYIGFVMLKQIEDEVGWLNYLQKNIKEFEDDVKRQPILIDDFDVLLDYQHFCDIDVND